MSFPSAPPDALLRLTTKAVSLYGNGINKYILWQLPRCNITSNPYSDSSQTGATGTFGLFDCVAIQNGAISVVVWFYVPSGGQGVLLSFQDQQYPSNESVDWISWLYIGTDGRLYATDWCDAFLQAITPSPISPGWHMAVVEEWADSTTGPYHLALYLDGTFIGSSLTSNLPTLFGGKYPYNGDGYPYSDIGAGYSNGFPATNNNWFFFNGTIAYVALYNRVLRPDEVMAIYQGCEISNGLVAKYTGDSYDPLTGTWVDTVNGYNATLVPTGYKPDVINLLSLRDCPTCPPPALPRPFPPIVGST